MTTRTRRYTTVSIKTDETIKYEQTLEQPVLDFVRYKAFLGFWYMTWKLKPVAWLIDKVLDPVADFMHKRECDGDCVTATRTRDKSTFPACGRMPLDAILDCKLYDLEQRNTTVLDTKRL